MNQFRLAVFNTQPPHLYKGGVERRINETTCRLTGQIDIAIYSGAKAGFKKPLNVAGVNFVPLKSTDKVYPLDNLTFNRSVSKNFFDADVYEAHNDSGYGLLEVFKNQVLKKAFVHTVHGPLADEFEQAKRHGRLSFRGRVANRFMARLARLEERTAKEADLIVTVSQCSFEKLQKYYSSIDPSKVRVVPNGVDLARYKPQENSVLIKSRFGLDLKVPVVLFVGSLIPRKGVMFLVEVAKQVVKTIPRVQFVVDGEGPLKGPLLNRLAADRLVDNFVFKSGLSDENLSALYGCCDVFVLPSLQEGQGIVLLEASASEKPVVAFNIGGVNEVVVDGKTGLLVSRENSVELAEALLRLLGDVSLRQKLGLAGRQFVGENFTWDICAQKLFTVYQEAMSFVV